MNRCIVTLAFTLLITFDIAAQDKKGTLSGIVVDKETLEPLTGANLMLQNSAIGSATNTSGEFTISNVPAGIYTLIVRYIGYETLRQTDIVIGSNSTTQLELELTADILDGQEVTVTSGYFSGSADSDISMVSFNPEEIRRSPGAAQELGRVLTATPGVASRGETSQDLIVRGGSPMENGYYIDNIPLPGVRHFENRAGTSNGPIGIVNTELIRSLDFSTGGFSVAYGNHLSSVSDINYREGSRDRTNGDIGANLAGFNVNLEGPLHNKSGSYLMSVRRSYLDLIASAINTGGAPSYGDLQVKLVYDPDERNKLTMLNIYGTSLFESSLEDALEEGVSEAGRLENQQNTTGINWRRLWSSGFTESSLSYSFDDQSQRLRNAISEAETFNIDSRKQEVNLRTVTYLKPDASSGIQFGADLGYEFSNFNYFIAAETNRGGRERSEVIRNNDIEGVLGSVFVSYTLRPVRSLSATFGTRGGLNSYNQNLTMDANASLRYQLTSRTALKGAFGMYHQTLPGFILSQNQAFRDLPDTRVFHYIAGIDYMLTDDTKVTLEAFQKEYRNAPVLPENNSINNPGFVLDNAGIFYSELEDNGTASARGVEVFLQKKLAVNFYGMVSASVFRAEYEDHSGTIRSRDYDNRYLFSVIGGYRPNDKWEVSARWTWMGGRPVTPINDIASAQAETEILDMVQYNDQRLPDFHSLYLRADRRFFFSKTNFIGFIELWNAYNRANVDSYFWNQTAGRVDETTQFSFLPVAGLKFEF